MKTYDWTKFTKKIAVKASMQSLYDAWTKSADIESWFLSNADYFNERSNQVDKGASIQKGYTYTWSWYLYDIEEKGRITEANGVNHLQFTFAGQCTVDINLTQQDEHVVVELIQQNIPTDDESKQNIRLGCDSGWAFFMVNLKSVYEGGIDLRNKNAALHGMLNN